MFFWLLRSLASSWDLWISSCKCVFSLQEQLSGKAKIQCVSWKKLLVYFSSRTTASPSSLSSLQAPCLQRDQLQAVLLGYSDSCVHYRRPRGKEKHIILPLSFLCSNWRAGLAFVAVSLSLPPESVMLRFSIGFLHSSVRILPWGSDHIPQCYKSAF